MRQEAEPFGGFLHAAGRGETAVAREQFVAADAGEGDAEPRRLRVFGDEPCVQPVERRQVVVVQRRVDVFADGFRFEQKLLVAGLVLLGGEFRVFLFVGDGRIVECQRVGVERDVRTGLVEQGDDGRAVDAAGKKRADGHVRRKLHFDNGFHLVEQVLEKIVLFAFRR